MGDNPFNETETIPLLLGSINKKHTQFLLRKSYPKIWIFQDFLDRQTRQTVIFSPYILLSCCSSGRLPDSYSQ